MIFSVDVPEELLPALVAELSTIPNPPSPQEYFEHSVIEILRQRCESYKVGPYYVGVTPPVFNADGTPYQPPGANSSTGGVA